jgi:hypothetical protein
MTGDNAWYMNVALRWLPASQGGRKKGPPAGRVYWATASLQAKDARTPLVLEAAFSIGMRFEDLTDGSRSFARMRPLFPENVEGVVGPGGDILILEGPHIVEEATILDIQPGALDLSGEGTAS